MHEARKVGLRRRQRVLRRIGFNPWVLATLVRWLVRDAATRPLLRIDRREMLFPMLSDVDVAIRNEMLGEAASGLLKVMCGRGIEIPRKNVTQGKRHYTTYFSRGNRLMVESLFRSQLRAFGDTFEGYDNSTPLIGLTSRGCDQLSLVQVKPDTDQVAGPLYNG